MTCQAAVGHDSLNCRDVRSTGAAVSFGTGVKVSSVSVESPFTLRVRLKVKKNATVGPRDVVITNPNGAMALGEALFEVR